MAPLHRAAAAATSDHQGAQMVQLDQGPQMIQHFTHPHPLQHLHMSKEFTCNGCNIIGQGPRYNCPSCDFHLHELCARSPFTLSSPRLHPRHPLTLVNVPGKSHFCDICGAIADGMFYTCQDCDVDIHPLCSQLPLTVQHAFHPQHPLMLQPGHPSSGCNVCRQGCGSWRYKCNECNHVDVHLNCVVAPQPQVQGGHSPTTPTTTPKWVPQPTVGHQNSGGGNYGMNQPNTNYQTTHVVVHPSGGGGGNHGTNQPVTNYQATQVVGNPNGGGGNYGTNQLLTNYQTTQVMGHPNGGGGNHGANQHVTNYQANGRGGNYGTNQLATNYQTAQAVGHPSGGGAIYGMNQLVSNHQTAQAMGYYGGNYGNNQLVTNYPMTTQGVGYPNPGSVGGNYGNNQVPVLQSQGSGNGRKNNGGQFASKLGKFAVNVVSTSIIGVPLISSSSKK